MGKQGTNLKRILSEPSSNIRFLLSLALATVLLRVFVIQAYQIPSASMEDTLLVGDFLIGNKLAFGAYLPFTEIRIPGYQDPQNNEVVVFRFPHDNDREFIKRCVAIPGQTVEIRDKVIYVNGTRTIDPERSKYVDPRVIPKELKNGVRDNYGPVTIPPNYYFLVGDNRDNSDDSRFWGFVPSNLILAKADRVYFSWEPDVEAPSYKGVGSLPSIFFYNVNHFIDRVRWSRIGKSIN